MWARTSVPSLLQRPDRVKVTANTNIGCSVVLNKDKQSIPQQLFPRRTTRCIDISNNKFLTILNNPITNHQNINQTKSGPYTYQTRSASSTNHQNINQTRSSYRRLERITCQRTLPKRLQHQIICRG